MDFRITWSPRARQALKSITDYIAADNPKAAVNLRRRMLAQIELLHVTPRIGQRFGDGKKAELRQLVEGNYRIFYEIDESRERVLILTVRHGARLDPEF